MFLSPLSTASPGSEGHTVPDRGSDGAALGQQPVLCLPESAGHPQRQGLLTEEVRLQHILNCVTSSLPLSQAGANNVYISVYLLALAHLSLILFLDFELMNSPGYVEQLITSGYVP